MDERKGRRYLKVRLSDAQGSPGRVGWVVEPSGFSAADLGAAPSQFDEVAAPTPVVAQVSGKFERFDRESRVLTLRNADGTSFDVVLRDDTMLLSRRSHRTDDYLELNPVSFPWSVGQIMLITWRPSADQTQRVALSVRAN